MKKLAGIGKMSLFASAFLWGFGFVAVDGALSSGWNPMLLLGVRGLIGGLFLHFFAFRRRYYLNRRMLKDGWLAGLYLTLAFAFQTYGQALSGASNAAFITALYVIFTPIILSIRNRKMMPKLVMFAAFVSMVGVGLISIQGDFRWQIGDVYLVLGAWMFAVHILQLEKLAHYDDALSITTIQLFTMGVVSMAFALVMNVSVPSSGYGYVVYCGLISSGIAFFLQTFGQKHVPSSTASIIMTFEAIFGVIGAMVFLHEVLSSRMLLGGLLLIGSVLVIELKPVPILLKKT